MSVATETQPARGTPPQGYERLDIRMPPGPRLPRLAQTLGFIFGGARTLEFARRRYGGAVTLGTVFDDRFVMVFDPELVKQVFQGSNEQLHAGEANALLGPVLGERSVLLLDGTEHLRHRRLLLPPFHGKRMQAYEAVVRDSTDIEIDSWPQGEEFTLLESMQALTLRVILRAVFGYEPGAAERRLQMRLREMIAPLARPRGLLLMLTLGRLGRDGGAAERFARSRRAVDEILFEEIAQRRRQPDLAERDDVFSALLLAEDEDGERLSDQEIRDELMTLLLAGHETTATGLGWTFDLLLHNPEVLKRAREGDERYLDAVIKESLRLRPVIPGVGRVVRGEPYRLGEYVIPPGVEINPSIRAIHRRGDLYPEPERFKPERFLEENPPDTYTWLPFGGGTRRCLGASFALMEMRTVVKRVLERAVLRAADPEPDEIQFRAITLAPKNNVRVVLQRRV
ncbi:MAG: cytochrome P450 [Solirubrobacterales bacterium]|nr:cytochrome P450 [Solirubrobacterales bacterium]